MGKVLHRDAKFNSCSSYSVYSHELKPPVRHARPNHIENHERANNIYWNKGALLAVIDSELGHPHPKCKSLLR